MVDIYIGPAKKRYRIHKTILCSQVEYFEKTFTNGFKETKEQTTTLPEVESPVFELFIEWVYRGSFPRPSNIMTCDPVKGYFTSNLIKLYGFAEYICLKTLKDYAVTSLISVFVKNKSGLSTAGISLVYQVTAPGSRLRAFAAQTLQHSLGTKLDIALWTTDNVSAIMMKNEDLTKDFLALLRREPKYPENPIMLPICTFHVHPKNEECRFKLDVSATQLPAVIPVSRPTNNSWGANW